MAQVVRDADPDAGPGGPRVAIRELRPVPPADMPRWQRLAAVGTHRLLYALILLQPLTGWLMSSYKNYPVSFWPVPWPDLVAPMQDARALQEVHEWLRACW